MAESPSSSAEPNIDEAALARRVIETLLQGGTIAECASEIDEFDGSLLAVYECLDRGMENGVVRRLVQGQQDARAVRLETLKTAALHQLWLLAFGDEIPNRGISADQMRAIEARRRACVSLIRLNPFPTRNDSYQDERGPRLDGPSRSGSGGERESGSHWSRGNDDLRMTSDEREVNDDSRDRHGRAESDCDDADGECTLEEVQQLAREINRAEHARNEFANRDHDEVDLEAITAFENEEPSPPAALPPPDAGEGGEPHLTRQQMRKRARDQRKREKKTKSNQDTKVTAAARTGHVHNPAVDRLETCRYRIRADDSHPP